MQAYKRINPKFIGDLLIERGVINARQLQEAIDCQKAHGGLLGESLMQLKYASEEDIAQALTSQYGFPYLPLSNYEIEPDVLSALTPDLCRQHCLIPIDRIGTSLTLAMANPLQTSSIEEIETLTQCTVQAFVSTATDIRAAIKKYYS